jgi:hypothetical protein
MAAPNLLGSTSVVGKTAFANLTTVMSNVLVNSTNSNSAAKIDNVILANYSVSSVTANVIVNRSASIYYLGGRITVPANSTLVLLGKDTSIYLEEGDYLQANTSANVSVSFSAGYELIS